MTRAKKYKILTAIFLPIFIFFALMAAVSVNLVDVYGPAVIAGFGVLALFPAIPTFYFMTRWRQSVREHGEARELANLLKSYGRVSLTDLAKRTGKNEADVEIAVMTAIGEGHITGFVDPDTRIFYYGAEAPEYRPVVVESKTIEVPLRVPSVAREPKDEVRYCRECGHRVEWVTQEGRWRCPSCGNHQL